MSQAVSKAILNDNSIGQKIKLSCHIGVARLTCTVACKNRQYDGRSTELYFGFGYMNWRSGLTDVALERCQDPKQLYEPEEEIGKRSSSFLPYSTDNTSL
ncbi:hypothetical protein T4A_9571 [Trichinella pseudospiralis]|uniref:Uncharacterized protein n=1 Tax=Trichinella pseudospiralis TaxID=6337 RepID=A0A0V0XWY2_TRIPS|nr:hypothetical protein T4E_8848 [Trichinella pseudospiralis]KRY73793.1 hypothetical protein T4A_9571 [Trichinella pseudospiralis]